MIIRNKAHIKRYHEQQSHHPKTQIPQSKTVFDYDVSENPINNNIMLIPDSEIYIPPESDTSDTETRSSSSDTIPYDLDDTEYRPSTPTTEYRQSRKRTITKPLRYQNNSF